MFNSNTIEPSYKLHDKNSRVISAFDILCKNMKILNKVYINKKWYLTVPKIKFREFMDVEMLTAREIFLKYFFEIISNCGNN